MKATSYFAGYKDSAKAPILYFGPFVSTSVAEFFLASLPTPLKGGWAAVRHFQPFNVQEGRTVTEMIMRDRRMKPQAKLPKSAKVEPAHTYGP
jgi:hypothetical protein